jgi:hypothetical protein
MIVGYICLYFLWILIGYGSLVITNFNKTDNVKTKMDALILMAIMHFWPIYYILKFIKFWINSPDQ